MAFEAMFFNADSECLGCILRRRTYKAAIVAGELPKKL